MLEIKDAVAVITGAAGGIGRGFRQEKADSAWFSMLSG